MSSVKIPIHQVDSFASRVFSGNPAAVCPLKEWLPDQQMQAIAAENNLANTAFFVPSRDEYDLRWFTPKVEVDLCGHATLASAFIIFHDLAPSANSIRFATKSGALIVTRDGDLLSLDFPSRPPVECEAPPQLAQALGAKPEAILGARNYLAVFSSEDDVRGLAPNMEVLQQLDRPGVIATAPGKEVDFVSRYFAPALGVPEDPVTGSAHCTLIPYWSNRLGKKKLHARQVSARGGDLWCEDRGERVIIGGKAVRFSDGFIYL